MTDAEPIGLVDGFGLTPKILEEDLFAEGSEEEKPAASGPITVIARDFRGLANVSFSPSGVCLVAGPNGSGKSALLEIFAFLRDAFLRGIPQALCFQRGAVGLRRIEADGPPEVLLALTVGEATWELRIPVNNGSGGEFAGEVVKVGPSVRVRRSAYSPEWYLGRELRSPDREGRTCFRAAWEAKQSPALSGLVEALRGFRYHAGYALEVLRDGGAGGEDDEHLHPNGQNLFLVLRNWQTAPRRFENRFEWVLGQMRRAFPGLIDAIEFDPPVGQVVPARFVKPDSRVGLPMSRAADGMLVGLLHLTAVASASNGALIAIDEMENQLHPHAIRSILGAMRELSEERDLTILLTTHSPALMNAFREHPEQFYVMDPGQATLPVALDKLHDPDWLAHFALGDLYDRMEFGAPPGVRSAELAGFLPPGGSHDRSLVLRR
jgi:predicted ATPase